MQRTAPPGSLGLDETLDTEDEGTLPAPKAAARRASSEKPAPEGTEFTGNERFELRRRLGAGGFGVVYEAWDRQRNLRVALKTLARIDPVALYQFKQEFRTLADIQHPHLVVFYELLSSAGHWFFTMELLEGLGLLEYVRPHLVAAPIVEDSTAAALFQSTLENPMTMTAPAVGAAASDAPRPAPVTSLPPLDEERVRLAFRQIAEGVAALHAIGKLHHDLKPSNVRVTNDGRVVLLDFGLARDLVPRASSAAGSAPLGDGRGAPADTERTASGSMANTHTLDGHLAGTPMYMAPERLTGVPVTEASDWYSVGIMLYEVLAGRQPFEGSMEEILRERLRREPPPPSVFAPTAPADLVSLCRDLLRMDPSRRPAGPEILQRLAAAQPADRPRLWAPSPRSQIFIGREAELAALGEALAATRRSPPQSGAPSGPQARPQRQPVILHVHGPSGMGKSALVQHFLADLQARDEAVVLGGRCYERESFPYKALDSAMDALARYLTRLPEAQVEGLLPPHLRTLTRLFPVLERIPAIERAAAAEAEVIDPQEQRRRAVAALRQLLVRLAERSPVVLALDDLQWGDLDSADLLGELLRVPQAPAVLLIASYRSDEVETSPFLRSLLASRALADVEVRHLPIAALSSEAARRLAEELVHGRAKGQDLQNLSVEAITREAGGSPYLIDALINYAEAAATVAPVHEEPPPAAMTAAAGATEPTTTPGDISPRLAISRLDRLLLARIEQLPAAARHLLEVVSVAGRPIEATLAAGAAGLQQVELEGLATLRAARLLRMRLTEDGEELEAYHDRIRETVVAALSPDLLRDRHRRLAHTLEASPRPALDALAAHFRGAGEPERAFSYAVAAADQAAHALAFERAAHLYEMALGLRTLERPGERELQIKCADALRHANRGAEAAQMYLAAARGLTGREAFALEQRAAEQFLLSGHLDAGREVLDAVLGRIGLGIAPTPLRALARFLLLRMRLWLRGLEFRKTDEAALSPEALVAVDTCRMVSLGLSMVDSIRAAEFQARGLLLALELGEPYRVSLTLSAEIPFSALDGGAQRERTAALSRQAEALALEVGEPHAIGLMRSSQAGAAWLEGRWRQALELAEESEDILRRRCTGVSWELGTSTFVILDALFYLGEWSRLRERLKVSLDDACARGDLRSEVQLRIAYASALALAADDPRTARAELEAIERWTRTSFHFLHTLALLGQCREAIYSGRGEEAWQTISRQWSVLQSHMQFRVQYVFILMLDLRARCALAAARAPTGTNPRQVRRLLAAADKDADTLEHLGVPWSEALAALVRAGVAAARGEEWPTLTALERAEAACLRADMSLHAWVARHCRGRVLGAAKGRRLREEAEAALRAQGAQAPERLSAWFVPAPWPDA